MAAGLDPVHVLLCEGEAVDDILESIYRLAGPSALVVGMGNIGGSGIELVRRVHEASQTGSQLQRKAA